LAVGRDHRVFHWDVPIVHAGEDHRRLMAEFVACFFWSGPLSTVPLVEIRGGFRCLFQNSWFYGVNSLRGEAAAVLFSGGGLRMDDCHTKFNPGALLEVDGGGEVLVTGSRSEGAYRRPAWQFRNASNLTLINLANEGKGEGPALIDLENCTDVEIINPQLALADVPYDAEGHFADGIQLRGCDSVAISGAYGAAYQNQAVGRAVALRVDGECSNIRARLQTGSLEPATQVAIDERAVGCSGEIWSRSAKTRAVWYTPG